MSLLLIVNPLKRWFRGGFQPICAGLTIGNNLILDDSVHSLNYSKPDRTGNQS